jgi:ribonuclease HI
MERHSNDRPEGQDLFLRDLPDAPESRSQPQILHFAPVALAHNLVPGLEGLPKAPGGNREILIGLKEVILYTDGACDKNPGPGGYGAVLIHGRNRKELSGGYRLTTNNRMELMAVIQGLEALKEPCKATIYSDSEYLVRAMNEGWAQRWKKRGWRRSGNDPAANPDLWEKLLALAQVHQTTFVWVRGHAGNAENERCDRLAVQARRRPNLPPDEVYEGSDITRPGLPGL